MRETMMSRLALLLCSVGAICNASVITTAGDARVASRELFHYYDIDTSMSFPCPSSKSKSLKGKGLPPPPPPPPTSKGKKGSKLPKDCKEPPPPKLPKSSKGLPIPGKGKGIAPPTKAPTPTMPTKAPSPSGNSTLNAIRCNIIVGHISHVSFLSCLCSPDSASLEPYR
jgi:hypothetical protein